MKNYCICQLRTLPKCTVPCEGGSWSPQRESLQHPSPPLTLWGRSPVSLSIVRFWTYFVPECQGYMKRGDIQLSEILPNCVDVSHLKISWILKCLSLQWWCVEILQIFTSSLLKVKKSGFLTVSFFPVDLCFSWMTKRTWSLKKT